jgi:hypothetical protein
VHLGPSSLSDERAALSFSTTFTNSSSPWSPMMIGRFAFMGVVWSADRTHLPLLQADAWMDHPSPQASRAGRPVELADCGGLPAAAPGASVRCGLEAALGEAIRCGQADPVSGSPGCFGAFARARNSCQTAKTLRSLSREAQRPPLGPGKALSGRQEGRLSSSEQPTRSFCDGLLPRRKTPRG